VHIILQAARSIFVMSSVASPVAADNIAGFGMPAFVATMKLEIAREFESFCRGRAVPV
jgi:3-dehydroquinate dehydratase